MIGGGLSQAGRDCHRASVRDGKIFGVGFACVSQVFAVPLPAPRQTCQSTGVAATRVHALILATVTGVASTISGTTALAAPFAGTGHAAIGGETDGQKARSQALERARKAALEAAIEQLGTSDAAIRKQVLANPSGWTGSYRVLQHSDDGATATAIVSVEIDTARLGKVLAGSGAGTTSGGLPPLLPSLTVDAKGCPEALADGLRRGLLAAGVIRDVAPGSAGPVLTASLECRAGVLKYPRQAVIRVAARWSTAGLPDQSVGVGEDPAAATNDAAAGLAGRVGQILSAKTAGGVRLKLAAPWPAARVRRLERALRESVVGVQGVTLAGVASDGSVTLQIEGSLTAEELHARLSSVTVPGATLVVGEVDGSNVVHASLQASSRPEPAAP